MFIHGVFESVHGSVPKYAGQDRINPTAMILSACLMLRHLGYSEGADRVENAVATVIREGKVVTRDLGGTAKTSEMTQAIIHAL